MTINIGTTLMLTNASTMVIGKIGLIMNDSMPDGCHCTLVQDDGAVGILSLQWNGLHAPDAHYAPPGVESTGIGDKVLVASLEEPRKENG